MQGRGKTGETNRGETDGEAWLIPMTGPEVYGPGRHSLHQGPAATRGANKQISTTENNRGDSPPSYTKRDRNHHVHHPGVQV